MKRTIKPLDVVRILEVIVLLSIIIGAGLMFTNNLELAPIAFISFSIGALAVLGILILIVLMTIVNWHIINDRLVQD